ncbi:MAG: hypothetical protein DMG37_02305 [Acidobacteria bacterium]|nr:MAG: hypothetical protein DMG37_02305 [Acidobacteriota bacterium]
MNRDVREIVLRLPKSRADDFRNSYHLERPAIDQDLAADGIHVGKKFGRQVVADHGHQRAALIIALGNVASLARRYRINVSHVGGHAANVYVVDAFRASADFSVGAQFHAHAQRQLQVCTQRFVIVPGHFLVAAVGLHVLFHVGDEREARQQEHVGAEIRDAVGDVSVYPGNQRNHDNQCGNRQNDAQQHQEGAHLVLAQRLQRHTHRFANQHSALQHAPLHPGTPSLLILRKTHCDCFVPQAWRRTPLWYAKGRLPPQLPVRFLLGST